MNLFSGFIGGPQVTNVRPTAPRISFFKEYVCSNLDLKFIRLHLPSGRTSKKVIKYCCPHQHSMNCILYSTLKTEIRLFSVLRTNLNLLTAEYWNLLLSRDCAIYQIGCSKCLNFLNLDLQVQWRWFQT
jgi:hypothetical protein